MVIVKFPNNRNHPTGKVIFKHSVYTIRNNKKRGGTAK